MSRPAALQHVLLERQQAVALDLALEHHVRVQQQGVAGDVAQDHHVVGSQSLHGVGERQLRDVVRQPGDLHPEALERPHERLAYRLVPAQGGKIEALGVVLGGYEGFSGQQDLHRAHLKARHRVCRGTRRICSGRILPRRWASTVL